MKKIPVLIAAAVFASLCLCCSKEDSEQINFDYNRILGVYKTSIYGLPGYPNLFDLDVSVKRQDTDTFYFSFDMQEYDPFPDMKFILSPSEVDEHAQFWTMVWADIDLILKEKYVQLRRPYGMFNYDADNYIIYADTYGGDFARFHISFQSRDSLDTDSYISVSGKRDY